MTVLELLTSKGIPEVKACDIYGGQNKTPIEEADIDKKAVITCPGCKKNIKMKPSAFVELGCVKCGYKPGV